MSQLILDLRKPVLPNKQAIDILVEFGFVNTPIVIRYNKDMTTLLSDKKSIDYSNKVLETYKYYEEKYPYTFIHDCDFENFLKKNKLKFIKSDKFKYDISEKMIGELKESKTVNPLVDTDIRVPDYEIIGLKSLKLIKYLGKNKPIFTQQEVHDLLVKYNIDKDFYRFSADKLCTDSWLREIHNKIARTHNFHVGWEWNLFEYNGNNVIEHNYTMNDVFVLVSRFNLLDKDAKYIFRYCKNGIQIITK